MAWLSARYRTATRGGEWGYDAMNGIQDWMLRTDGLVSADLNSAVADQIGVDQSDTRRAVSFRDDPLRNVTVTASNPPVVALSAASGLCAVTFSVAVSVGGGTIARVSVLKNGVSVQSSRDELQVTSSGNGFLVVPVDGAATFELSVLKISDVASPGKLDVNSRRLWVVAYDF